MTATKMNFTVIKGSGKMVKRGKTAAECATRGHKEYRAGLPAEKLKFPNGKG